MNPNTTTEPMIKETVTREAPEFDPYQNEGVNNASQQTPDISPDAEEGDSPIDLVSDRAVEGAGMRDGGLTGNIQPDR